MPAVSRERPYRTLSQRHIWRSPWYSLRQDRLQAADGSTAVYHVVDKPGAVWIVPVTADGHLVMIEQYRYPVDDWCLEIPAGSIEPGSTPEAAAARELAEEVGGVARGWTFVAWFYSLNGISNQIAHVYVAWDVMLGLPQREATEHMTVHRVPIDEALRMAAAGEISDGPSALALLLSERVLRARREEENG